MLEKIKNYLENKIKKMEEKIIDNTYLPCITINPEKGLPSKGKPYPKDVIIKYYPFTFGEVKYYSQSKLGIEDKYNFVLNGIKVNNIDKLDLTYSDFVYLGILRNLSTFNSKRFEVKFLCDSCDTENKHIINFKDLEFEELEVPDLPITIDFSFGKYSFMPLTVRDMIEITKNNELEKPEMLFFRQCTNKKILKKVIKADIEDLSLIGDVDKALYHGVKPIMLKCKKCEKEREIKIDGGDGDIFISPFRKRRRPYQDRIHFGA